MRYAQTFLPILLLLLCSLPWLTLEADKALNHDIVFLIRSFNELMQGAKFGYDIYDPNPPLNFLIYAPFAWYHALTGVSLEYTVLIVATLMAAVSATIAGFLTRQFPDLEPPFPLFIALLLFLSYTLVSYPHLGQRDHIIVMALVPFLLAQCALTRGVAVAPRLLWPVLLIGAIAVLIKPHYGLLPCLLFLHRAISQKRLRVIYDPDFIALAAATLGYVVTLMVFFPDYLRVMLPEAVWLYKNSPGRHFYVQVLVFGLFPYMGLLLGWMCIRGQNGGWLVLSLFLFSLASLAPYVTQGKGFHYHLVPFKVFFATALGLSLIIVMRQILTERRAFYLALLAVSSLAYALIPFYGYPTRDHMRTLPLVGKVRAACQGKADCKIFFMHVDFRLIQLTMHYAGAKQVTRFPSFWFFPAWHKKAKENEALKDRIAGMVAADLAADQPDLIIDCPILAGRENVDVLSESHEFRAVMASYPVETTIEFDRAGYYKPQHTPIINRCVLYKRSES